MTSPASLVFLLRNTPIRELVRALERDGFIHVHGKGSHRVYEHEDQRIVVLNYHRGNDTLPRSTLGQVLSGARWTVQDAKRLRLI